MAQISEEDRIRLENRTLRRLMEDFAAVTPNVREDTSLHLQRLVRRARNLLQSISQQKRAPRPPDDPMEIASHSVVRYANLLINRRAPGEHPPILLCLDKLGPRSWEAYVEDHDELRTGKGRTALEAMQRLNGSVKQAWQEFSKKNRDVVVEVRVLRNP